MSDSIEGLKHQLEGAAELHSVVRTMKTLAASNIGQYERAVTSLNDYYRTLELGMSVCLRMQEQAETSLKGSKHSSKAYIVVFGSDQGLVGQFNDLLAEYVVNSISNIPEQKLLWTIGERIESRLADAGCASDKTFDVPNSVYAITPLVQQILLDIAVEQTEHISFYIFYNRLLSGGVIEPTTRHILPLDSVWKESLKGIKWPSSTIPQALGGYNKNLLALINEYLFVSLFKACAESLVSENTSRMEAMQRAEKNINDLLDGLTRSFNLLRQTTIDEELFDIISGFEAMSKTAKKGT